MTASARSYAPDASSQHSWSAVKETNHPYPNRPSSAQSVSLAPTEMDQGPMATA